VYAVEDARATVAEEKEGENNEKGELLAARRGVCG